MAADDEPVVMGDVRARAVKGRMREGRLYWRAELGRQTVWTGWATRAEVGVALARLVAEGVVDAPRPQFADVRTWRDLAEYFAGSVVEARRDIAASTRALHLAQLKRIAAQLGAVRLDRTSRATMDGWVAQRGRAGAAPLTIRLDLVMVRRLWAWGREVGACPDRELALPEVRATPRRPKRTPTAADLEAVLAHLEQHRPAWTSLFMRVQVALGARLREVHGIAPGDIDTEAGTVRLDGKTGPRVVPISAELGAAMLELHAQHPSSATVWGVARQDAAFARVLRRSLVEMGMPAAWTSHAFRRLAVDQMRSRGVPVEVAAALLGHSIQTMLTAYRTVSREELVAGAALARLGFDRDRKPTQRRTLWRRPHRSAHRVSRSAP